MLVHKETIIVTRVCVLIDPWTEASVDGVGAVGILMRGVWRFVPRLMLLLLLLGSVRRLPRVASPRANVESSEKELTTLCKAASRRLTSSSNGQV
jgi:hypothetical protein